MTGLWAGSHCVRAGVDGCGHEHGVHDYDHLTPAPSVSAIVARSDNARVKRARIAFTTPPHMVGRVSMPSGNRAVFRGRSLAWRRHLAMGLPGTVGSRGANVAPGRTLPAVGRKDHLPVVLGEASRLGQCPDAPASAPRPCIAASTTTAAPVPINRSPMLKTLASGTHEGIANRSVRGARTTRSRGALFEYSTFGSRPMAASVPGLTGMYPPLATMASRLDVPPASTKGSPGMARLAATAISTATLEATYATGATSPSAFPTGDENRSTWTTMPSTINGAHLSCRAPRRAAEPPVARPTMRATSTG